MLTAQKEKLTQAEGKAYVLICQRHPGTAALAQGLHVSRATAARTVAALRRKGFRIVSVRERGTWHFELRNRAEVARERWRRLRSMVGFVKDWHPLPGKGEDAVIYDED
jgi:hypothetical protein